MKSKKAQEYINTHPLFMAKTFAKNAVEIAEKESGERAVEAFKKYMKQQYGGWLSSDLNYFIQKLNER